MKKLAALILLLVSQAYAAPEDYLVTVNLPMCDGSANVKHISQNADWADINDPQYDIFCVYPGDYDLFGVISITQSGTDQSPKWIRWYDPADSTDTTTHPYHNQAKAANVRSIEISGDHWIVDRISGDNEPWSTTGNFILFNRLWLHDMSTGMISMRGNDIQVQHSFFGPHPKIPGQDRETVYVGGGGDTDGSTGSRNKIIANEGYNLGDFFQAGPDAGKGLVISGNDVYNDSDYNADCSDGSPDPEGLCSCSEQPVTFKGPLFTDTWHVVEDNTMRDIRNNINLCGGTGANYASISLSSHAAPTRNILFQRNIITGAHPAGGAQHGVQTENIIYKNNIFDLRGSDNNANVSALATASDTVATYFEGNTVIGSTANWMRTYGGANQINSAFRCNAFIDSGEAFLQAAADSTFKIVDNFYYNTPATSASGPPDRTQTYGSSASANNTDLVIDITPISNPGATMTVTGVKPTTSSPHYGCINWMGS